MSISLRLVATLFFLLSLAVAGAMGFIVYQQDIKHSVTRAQLAHEQVAAQAYLKLYSAAGADVSQPVLATARKAGVNTIRVYNASGQLLLTSGGVSDAKVLSQRIREASSAPSRSSVEAKGRVFSSVLVQGEGQSAAYFEMESPLDSMPSQTAMIVAGGSFGSLLVMMIVLLALGGGGGGHEAEVMELTEQNAEMRKKLNDAQSQSDASTQLLANASHELRTPLNAIMGFADHLHSELEAAKADPKQLSYVADIRAGSQHLLDLVNDILDFSKAEAGKLEFDIEEVNLTKLGLSCLRLVQTRAEKGRVSLINALPKDSLAVETDAQRMKQVLLNLLSNAVKFTPEDGKVTLRGWYDLSENKVVIQVDDTGVGMQSKDISRAMAEFGQVENEMGKKVESTGLGLPITRKFVELLGGKLNIQSAPGRGTSVTVTLPREFHPRKDIIYRRVS